MQNNKIGFSLIELMVCLVIIAIVITLAVPSYSKHQIKVRRAHAAVIIMDIARQLESYHIARGTYQNFNLNNINLVAAKKSYYIITLSNLTVDNYIIRATPIEQQAKDFTCGSLLLEANGRKSITGTGKLNECW